MINGASAAYVTCFRKKFMSILQFNKWTPDRFKTHHFDQLEGRESERSVESSIVETLRSTLPRRKYLKFSIEHSAAVWDYVSQRGEGLF
jgi:hypothetical protein